MNATISFQLSKPEDANAFVKMHTFASDHLTALYGRGPWSCKPTTRGVSSWMRTGSIYIARENDEIVAAFRLSPKKPWGIDLRYLTPVARPLYLTGMCVAVEKQRQGIGRLCIEKARKVAKEWPADSIRLDAFDHAAGAGGFYEKCGFKEKGRGTFRNAALIYYELLLGRGH
jgi:GNAT superfamily N-acetyltransferase